MNIAVRHPAERGARAVAMEMMYRYGAISQDDIGKALGGLDYTTVSLERKRLRQKLETDKALLGSAAGSDRRNLLPQ